MKLLFFSAKETFALCNTFGKSLKSNAEKNSVCKSTKVKNEFYLIYCRIRYKKAICDDCGILKLFVMIVEY